MRAPQPCPTRSEPRLTGTTVRGVVVRNNPLENNASIILRSSVHDVLIEHNTLRHGARGMVAGHWMQRLKGVLLRGNHFDAVTIPIEPGDFGFMRIGLARQLD